MKLLISAPANKTEEDLSVTIQNEENNSTIIEGNQSNEDTKRLAEKQKRLAEEEEAKRLAEEEEAKRLAEEEEAKRLAEVEEAKRLAEEEAKRLAEKEITADEANNLYADVELYIKNGGDIDLVEFGGIYARGPELLHMML